MLTLSHELPAINPTDAEITIADRLAWHNDSADNDWRDGYPGVEWDDPKAAPYVPTPAEEAEERGYQVGLTGDRPGFNEAFADDPSAATDGRALAFTVGRNRGNREHAGRIGYELGLGGQAMERPASVHRLVAAEFEAGWKRGFADYCERQAILADYFRDLDREQERWEEEQENRARMGWPTPAAWCPALEA